MSLRLFLLILLCLLIYDIHDIHAQSKRHTVSGTISDHSNGELLLGAQVFKTDNTAGVASNSYGFYSITLPAGKNTIHISYLGYDTQEIEINLNKNEVIDVKLRQTANQMGEVIVTAASPNRNVSGVEMSVERLTAQTISSIPALMGEVDIIKAVQLLPGVQATSEGSSGFSIRGGGHDQNLIMLDEATVYNASHLMGFFSVFNNDAVKDITLYKGDIPATFGGRLSSLLDIRSKDGNNRQFTGSGGIGLIASRITLEGPIAKDKAAFLISGRRTYADLFLKLSSDKDLRDTKLYFYDANLKLNYSIDHKNRIFLSGYAGRDNFETSFAGMDFGNKTATLRWNHIFTPKLFSNFTLISSFYDYGISADIDESLGQKWKSAMNDFGFKADMAYHPANWLNLKFGYDLVYHHFRPGNGGGTSANSIIDDIDIPKQYALEQAGYIANEISVSPKFKLKAGLRFSVFQNIANGEEIKYIHNYKTVRTETYKRGKIYNTRHKFEPRFGALYIINDANSVKASYTRMAQYIQLASNSSAGSPLDVWFQSSQNVKPQIADQASIGYFRNFQNNAYELSAEIYYRDLKNVVDFKDHANLIANEDLEEELRFGKGRAYGLEVMLRKNTGKLNGWISYTFAKANRTIDEINDGKQYRSPYDKPHNISIVANYDISRKWSVAANWVYASGTPITYPTGRYLIENNYVPIYSGRNEFRYPAYHRLDVSATVQLTKPEKKKKMKNELNFSLYNAYGRRNPWTILFKQEDDNPDKSYVEAVYLFSIVPSITWNFTF